MGYKLNIKVSDVVSDTTEGAAQLEETFTCPVCNGIDLVGCLFCFESGVVSADKLATYSIPKGL